MNVKTPEFYTCPFCKHEDDSFKFATHCPMCESLLEDAEAMIELDDIAELGEEW